MKVVWSDPAVEDLESIHTHILHDSEHYARQFIGRILDAAESLEQFPRRGRQVPEARDLPEIREFLFRSYRVLYRVEASRVLILAVIHGMGTLSVFVTPVAAQLHSVMTYISMIPPCEL